MKKVLLVEDDRKIVDALSFALQEEGFEVVCSEDGPGGLETAYSAKPDIILLDIMLPGMNGIEVCRTLRSEEEHKATPIIMMTALGDTENIVKGLASGASDYISKPYNLSELLARMRSHMKMKELFDIVKTEEEEKSALLDVSQSLSSTIDPHETLYIICSKVAEVIEVKRCSIIFIDIANRRGSVMASHDSNKVKHLEIDLDKYPEIQKIMDTGEPVIINDVYNDPILFSVQRTLSLIDIRSIMGFPVVFKDTLIGTLILRTSRREAPFNEREIKFCSVISHLAASPLKNAYLFEILHREKEQERECRIAAELRSQESRELLETIMEASPVPICVFDREGKVTDVNQAFQSLSGLDLAREKMLGFNLLKNSGSVLLLDFYKKILDGEKPEMELDTLPYGKEGSGTYIYQGAPLYDYEKELIGGMLTINDITERKKAEELISAQNKKLSSLNMDLEISTQKAQEANKLKTEFLANVTHELRTPLTSILGFSKLISGQYSLPKDIQEFGGIINKQGGKLLDMVDDLLDLSKIEMQSLPFDFSSVNLNNILRTAVLSQNSFIVEKKHRLAWNLEKQIPALWLDSNKILRVFINIINNAIKFTSPGGEITITTREKGGVVEGIIQDNGQGVKEEDQEIIFDRFRQLDGSSTRKFSGLGLGLDLAKHVVEKMSGSIRVESEPGKGSSFFVSFPVEGTPPDEGTT